MGDIDSVRVVYFNIPRMQMSPPYLRAKLCIEDLPIPSSVGGRQCDGGEAQGWNNCWLIVATREGSNVNPDDTQHCESEDKNSGTGSCYKCLCKGSYFGAGSVPGGSQVSDTLVDSCGPRSPERWGASCDDVQNARRIPASDRVNLSNHSTVQINICPEASDGCSVCQGSGYHPAFEVGLSGRMMWSSVRASLSTELPLALGMYKMGYRLARSPSSGSLLQSFSSCIVFETINSYTLL